MQQLSEDEDIQCQVDVQLIGNNRTHPNASNEHRSVSAPVWIVHRRPAGRAHNNAPRFAPGHILVRHLEEDRGFLPIDILPEEYLGTCWTAQHLSWATFVDKMQRQLEFVLADEHYIVAQVGLPKPMLVQTDKDWRLAMQMCHDRGLTGCEFRVSTVVELPQRERGAQLLATIGIAAAGVLAMKMGFYPFPPS